MTTIHEDLRIQGSRDSGERIDSALESSNPRSLDPFQFVSFTKGAIDALLEKSSGVLTSERRKPLAVAEIMNVNDRMAADGLRVIGIAVRALETLPVNITPDTIETDLAIVGLVGLMDPPGDEVKDAVASCKTAGIRPVMITGDHPITAKAIANRLGILDDDSRSIMTGRILQELTLEEFEEKVEKDVANLVRAFAIDADYLQDTKLGLEQVNFADRGYQLTRSFRALKVWMSIQTFGLARFREAIAGAIELASEAGRLVTEDARLELLSPPSLGVLCFRYRPSGKSWTAERLDALNDAIQARLIAYGTAMISSTRLNGRYALRLCVLSHQTTLEDVRETVLRIAALGRELESERPGDSRSPD